MKNKNNQLVQEKIILEKQLNEEKIKNQNKENEMNNKINQLVQEKTKLENELTEVKTKIQNKENEMNIKINQLEQENKNLDNKLKDEKTRIQNLLEKINNFKTKNTETKIENFYLKAIYNNNSIIKQGEKIIGISFVPVDQSFMRPISCKNTDTLASLEEKIYNEYPQYKEYNTYLTVNGKSVKRYKTIEENGIIDSNNIIINIYQ